MEGGITSSTANTGQVGSSRSDLRLDATSPGFTPYSTGTMGHPTMRHGTHRLDNDRKIGHRRVDQEGNVSYKKTPSSELMAAIQLGIAQSLVNLKSAPQRDVLLQDFAVVDSVYFPSKYAGDLVQHVSCIDEGVHSPASTLRKNDGSQMTGSHHFSDFRFKTYSPVGFRHLRDMFEIPSDDFLVSVCNNQLKELTNPGASGSIFFLSRDDEFIIKTVQHKEADFLQKLLPGYYMNLVQNPRTLLPKFFGLFCYQCSGKNIRLIIMNNLLPTSIPMHTKYDLKGSTFKRKASKGEKDKKSPTFKDLDFMKQHPTGIELEVETYEALEKTMRRDVRVLESFKIMDYSLLLGIHNLDQYDKEKLKRMEERREERLKEEEEAQLSEETQNEDKEEEEGQQQHKEEEEEDGGAIARLAGAGLAGAGLAGAGLGGASVKAMFVRQKSVNRERLSTYTTAMESITAEQLNDPIDLDEDIPIGGIPARNSKGDRLLLFIGIIDILQNYRLVKKMEHVIKAVVHDGDTVSVHRPDFYAQRFLDFVLKKVFRKVQSPLKHTPSKRGKNFRTTSRPSTAVEPTNEGPIGESGLTSHAFVDDPSVNLHSSNGEQSKTSLVELHASSPSVTIPSISSSSLPPLHGHIPPRMADLPEETTTAKFNNSDTTVIGNLTVNNQGPLTHGFTTNLLKNGVTSDSSSSGISSAGATTLSHLSPQLRRVLIPDPTSAGAWSPPQSWAGSTPTHTEGTPSFTESSSSEWIGDVSHGSVSHGSMEIINRRSVGRSQESESQESMGVSVVSTGIPATEINGINGLSLDESRTPTLTPREGGSLDLTPTTEPSISIADPQIASPPLPSTSPPSLPLSAHATVHQVHALLSISADDVLHEACPDEVLFPPSVIDDLAHSPTPSFSEQLKAHRESLNDPALPTFSSVTNIDEISDITRPSLYIPRAELLSQLHKEMEDEPKDCGSNETESGRHGIARGPTLARQEALENNDDLEEPEMEVTYL